MSIKKFIFLIAATIGSIAIGTTVIYRKIDALRHGICNRMQWYYKDSDGKFHDLV